MSRRGGHWRLFRRTAGANFIGAGLLLVAVVWSLSRVVAVERESTEPTRTILRLSHWGLEANYRDSFQAVIDDYERIHPDVTVVQMGITERVYNQWLNTQILSGTAPDIAEALSGGVAAITDQGQDQYVAQYFLPLSVYADRPNPYNAGTSLENVPWRDTFLDGMRGGFRPFLQEYYGPPTTVATTRICYNRALLREATGSDKPPKTMGELLEMCRSIARYSSETGRDVVPIAGSRYGIMALAGLYGTAFTSGYEDALDTDLDGHIGLRETYAGFVRNNVAFDDPPMRAWHECLVALTRYYPDGFMSFGREQSLFLFARGRAVMMMTGSHRMGSLLAQSEFEIGVFPFPMPAPGERWGALVFGRPSEGSIQGSGTYAVYKHSKNREQAIDFLRYLTSQPVIEKFTWKTGFLPPVIGADSPEHMRPFRIDLRGFDTRVRLQFGAGMTRVYTGQLWRLLQGEISYESYASELTRAMRDPRYGGDRAWADEYEQNMRICRDQERSLALHATHMILEPSSEARSRFRRGLLQQVRLNNGENLRHRFEQLRGTPLRVF